MAQFGELSMVTAAILTLLASIMSIWGKQEHHWNSARNLFLAAALMGTVAACALVFLLVTHDYRVTYVRAYADRTMSTGFLITALWGGQQGSLMFWAMLQSWFAAAMAFWLREPDMRVQRAAQAIMGGIGIFFWVLVLTQSNPFTLNGEDPLDSFGMNPLLRNAYMVFHPPTLFVGFAGFSVPLAVGLAVMKYGVNGNDWLMRLRPWVLVAFIFLSVGNILGMVWAYEELGWGGYWGWDPVENASLMPWFTATALVHSIIAQRRWGILKRWNLSLIVVTYLLTIFGTFLTRSGIIQSVHAFSDATEGPYLLGMIGTVLLAFIFLLATRYKAFAPDGRFELWSKQWMFEVANWLFVISVVFVGMATMWPLFTAVFKGEEATVSPAFFNKWMVPIGLTIFATMGACTIFPVDAALKNSQVKKNLSVQVLVLLFLALAAALLVGRQPDLGGAMTYAPAVAVGLSVFATGALLIQMRKSYLSGNTVRLGGQLVHLAMVLMYVGFTGSGFIQESKANMGPGEFMYIDDVKVTYMGLRSDVNFEREAIFADLEVAHQDGAVEVVSPARYLYHSHPNQPTSEVQIAMAPERDLFFILGETEFQRGRAIIKVLANPLVMWIWIGGVLLVIGAFMAMSRGSLRSVLEMKPPVRKVLAPMGAGALALTVVLVAGTVWKGVPGGVAFTGALGLAGVFWLLAKSVFLFGHTAGSPEK